MGAFNNSSNFGRADKGAAYMLHARLALNSAVYTKGAVKDYQKAIECTHFGKIRFYVGQFLVNPVIKFFTGFLYGQLINVIRSLERSLSPKVEEVPHVKGTQETNFCTILFIIRIISFILSVSEIEITKSNIKSQTLERPLHANR